MATQTARRKRCSQCHQLKDDVGGKQKLCLGCESDMDYCKVCDEWQRKSGEQCRHIQWSDAFGCLCGCGTWDVDAEAHQESFVAVLKRLRPLRDFDDKPLVASMYRLIRANNFWTQWHGPMIGGPPYLAMRYEQDFGTHKSILTLADISSSTQEDWGDEAIETMQEGMSWLCSLDDKTIEANKLTAKWIRRFLNEQY